MSKDTIEELEQTVIDIKTEIAQNEGGVKNILERLKKELGIDGEDDAHLLLEEMDKEIKTMTEQRDDLLRIASEKLEKYRKS